MTEPRKRRGVALLVALVAVIVVGALTAATLLRVQSELAIALDGSARRRAEAAAELALRMALATGDRVALRSRPIGSVQRVTTVTGGVTTTIETVRTDSTLLWIVATGVAPGVRGDARSRVGASASIAGGAGPPQPLPGDTWVAVF
jgi:hypothetical protein